MFWGVFGVFPAVAAGSSEFGSGCFLVDSGLWQEFRGFGLLALLAEASPGISFAVYVGVGVWGLGFFSPGVWGLGRLSSLIGFVV